MKINKEWHAKNRMPKNPTLEQRIIWHLEHSKNCKCRPMPEKLKAEFFKRKKRSH
jgi:hypothetical protein